MKWPAGKIKKLLANILSCNKNAIVLSLNIYLYLWRDTQLIVTQQLRISQNFIELIIFINKPLRLWQMFLIRRGSTDVGTAGMPRTLNRRMTSHLFCLSKAINQFIQQSLLNVFQTAFIYDSSRLKVYRDLRFPVREGARGLMPTSIFEVCFIRN